MYKMEVMMNSHKKSLWSHVKLTQVPTVTMAILQACKCANEM